MKIVYIAHPIGGDVEKNLAGLFRILRRINLTQPDIRSFAPYIADVCALLDSVPEEREIGIRNGIALINTKCFDECWLTGDIISSGMEAEQALFISLGIPVINCIGKF